MTKQVLDVHQMQHLKELGVDTSYASMCWIVDKENTYQPYIVLSPYAEYHVDITTYSLPTFTLQDILDLLPKEIRDKNYDKFALKIEYGINHKAYYIGYYYYNVVLNDNCLFSRENLIDAAYEMLCWCIENGHVKTAK